jgi:hypothetical protein
MENPNLIRQFTVDDEHTFVPKLNGPYDEARAVKSPTLRLPFGFCNDQWESMKAQMQTGDELWEFRSPEWTWPAMVGRAGVVLLREDQEIAWLITSMS